MVLVKYRVIDIFCLKSVRFRYKFLATAQKLKKKRPIIEFQAKSYEVKYENILGTKEFIKKTATFPKIK